MIRDEFPISPRAEARLERALRDAERRMQAFCEGPGALARDPLTVPQAAPLGHPLDRACYWGDTARFGREVFISPGDQPHCMNKRPLPPPSMAAPFGSLDPHGRVRFAWSVLSEDWPAMQALGQAILEDHLGDAHEAMRLSEAFARQVIAMLPLAWSLDSFAVAGMVDVLREQEAAAQRPGPRKQAPKPEGSP